MHDVGVGDSDLAYGWNILSGLVVTVILGVKSKISEGPSGQMNYASLNFTS